MELKEVVTNLGDLLEEVSGIKNIYYTAPSSGMIYPAIKYRLDGPKDKFADNRRYFHRNGWLITIIDEDPLSSIPDKIEELDYCSYVRDYRSDGLNHFVYRLYF